MVKKEIIDDDYPLGTRKASQMSESIRKRTRICKGESSNSKPAALETKPIISLIYTCKICAIEKPASDLFRIVGCNHSYCTGCIGKYVGSMLQQQSNNILVINCPESGCDGFLEPHHCQSILPKQVVDRWGDALCEATILDSEKFYCPFKDCSALLIDDNLGNGKIVVKSKCLHCNRFFCAQCRVPWHSGMLCNEFMGNIIPTFGIREVARTSTVEFFGDHITTIVTRDPATVTNWIKEVEKGYAGFGQNCVIGLDIKQQSGHDYRPATLQLCVGRRCLVWQTGYCGNIGQAPWLFFNNPSHTFVGIGINNALMKLGRCGMISNTMNAKAVALGHLAARVYGMDELRNGGLRKVAKVVLARKIEEPMEVGFSRWDEYELSRDQVTWACVRTHAYYLIGSRLLTMA